MQSSWYRRKNPELFKPEEVYVNLNSSVKHPITSEVIVSLEKITNKSGRAETYSLLLPDFERDYEPVTQDDMGLVLQWHLQCGQCDSDQPRGYFKTKEDAQASIDETPWCHFCQEDLSKRYAPVKTEYDTLKPYAEMIMSRLDK